MKSNHGREILFAYRSDMVLRKERDLFSEEPDEYVGYSEFHMSGGERSLLKLSSDISNLENALVLIDEIETALHPYTQHLLMLELQRLSLRNNLQVIVTSHSPAIFETVPPEARIFLSRDAQDIIVQEPYRDVLQMAFYGRSFDKLSILCEDAIAESVVRGAIDYLAPRMDLRHENIIVGRDTGKDEFPMHVQALDKFQELSDFVFVLDGDARSLETKIKGAGKRGPVSLLFLPGSESPEAWMVNEVRRSADRYEDILGHRASHIVETIDRVTTLYSGSTRKPSDANKFMFVDIANEFGREPTQFAREIARSEAQSRKGLMRIFVNELENAINSWRPGRRSG